MFSFYLLCLFYINMINGIDPAPIATPAEEIKGILLAEYLKPRRIIYIIDH